MRILHVITTIDRGGAENQLLTLVRQQIKSGNKVEVIPLKGKLELSQSFKILGCEINARLANKNFLFQIFHYLRHINKNAPNIIHAHLPQAELICSIKKGNSKLIVTRHNAENFAPKLPAMLSRICSRFVELRANSVIAISEAVKKFLIEKKEIKSENKIKVVYYGFDDSEVGNVEKVFLRKLDLNYINLVAVGRLVPQKDFPTLFHALKACKNADLKFKLTIYGDGLLKNYLVCLAESLDLSNEIFFHGRIMNIAKALKKFDVLILSSKYEGFGLILLEAMQSGIPILASHNSAIPEVLGSDHLGLFPTGNFKELSLLIQQSRNYKFRSKIIEKQFKQIKKFNPVDMNQHINMIYINS
jgi:glycosyltransferase involved in cell wall biosynthesis